MNDSDRKMNDAVTAARTALRDAMTKLDEACYILSLQGCMTTKAQMADQAAAIYSADASIQKAADEYNKESRGK